MPTKPRRQCKKCPWRVGVDPHDIPNGYCEKKHAALKGTIAIPGAVSLDNLRIMSCHGKHDVPCVGWLVNQLGTGNNIGLRLQVIRGGIDANVKTVGEQHATFEDTLPRT